MTNKVPYIFAGVIVILITMVVLLTNANTQKDGEIRLLKQKIETTEAVTDGINEGIDKLIRYNECTAKVFISPRNDKVAIQGSKDDPETALKKCRLEVDGKAIKSLESSSNDEATSNTTSSSTSPETNPPKNQNNNQPNNRPENPQPNSVIPGKRGCTVRPLGVCI